MTSRRKCAPWSIVDRVSVWCACMPPFSPPLHFVSRKINLVVSGGLGRTTLAVVRLSLTTYPFLFFILNFTELIVFFYHLEKRGRRCWSKEIAIWICRRGIGELQEEERKCSSWCPINIEKTTRTYFSNTVFFYDYERNVSALRENSSVRLARLPCSPEKEKKMDE